MKESDERLNKWMKDKRFSIIFLCLCDPKVEENSTRYGTINVLTLMYADYVRKRQIFKILWGRR